MLKDLKPYSQRGSDRQSTDFGSFRVQHGLFCEPRIDGPLLTQGASTPKPSRLVCRAGVHDYHPADAAAHASCTFGLTLFAASQAWQRAPCSWRMNVSAGCVGGGRQRYLFHSVFGRAQASELAWDSRKHLRLTSTATRPAKTVDGMILPGVCLKTGFGKPGSSPMRTRRMGSVRYGACKNS